MKDYEQARRDFVKRAREEDIRLRIDQHFEALELAAKIRRSENWDPVQLRRLCELAGLEDDWSEADVHTSKTVVAMAAKVLGVAISREV